MDGFFGVSPGVMALHCLVSRVAETCELDADFLKEAVNDKESFQHFLDDVINDYDVPADDIVLGLLDESVNGHRVSAKSPYQPAPSLNSCIFSTAGSTETKLCSSVSSSFPMTTCSSQWMKQADLFRTTFAVAATTFAVAATTTVTLSSTTVLPSSSSSSTFTMSSTTERKSDVKDSRLDEDIDDTSMTVCLSADDDDRFDWSVGSSLVPDAADLKATIDDNNNVFAAEQKEVCGDCLSVSVSHQISNGVCLLCSAARLMKAKDSCSCQGPDYFSSGPLRLGIPDLSPGNPSPGGGKRKSETDDDDSSCLDNDSAWKRARLCGEVSEGSSAEFSAAGRSETGGVLDHVTVSSTRDCQERPNPDEEKCVDSKKDHLLDILWLFHPDTSVSEDSLPLMTEQRFL